MKEVSRSKRKNRRFKSEVLFSTPSGTTFTLYRHKKRAFVKVSSGEKHFLMTYMFKNTLLYKHPYLSWENLDCCGKWDFNPKYMWSAVQNNKKLAVSVIHTSPSRPDLKNFIERFKYDMSEVEMRSFLEKTKNPYAKYRVGFIAARKGSLKDFFNIDEILAVYLSHGIYSINTSLLEEFFNMEIIDLFDEFTNKGYGLEKNIKNLSTEKFIARGLAYGYPIESTVSVL